MCGQQEHPCEQHAHACGERHGQPHCGAGMGQGEYGRCHCTPSCACGCHTAPHGRGHPSWRRFATREERLARLEKYLHELRAEAQAVEERIAEMRGQ